MKHRIIICLLCLCCCYTQAETTLTEEKLKSLTEQFILAKNARQQPDSDKQDVEHFISFLSDDFVDEHVKFNVTVTGKDELRQGMVAKLKDEIQFSNIDIIEMMIGRNVVFVKFREHAKGKPSHLDKVIEYTANNIWSLEFDENGKIKHLRRHHGL